MPKFEKCHTKESSPRKRLRGMLMFEISSSLNTSRSLCKFQAEEVSSISWDTHIILGLAFAWTIGLVGKDLGIQL